MEQLGQVLQLLGQQRWVANQSKCEFGRQQIGYLGHIISGRGVEMDREKIPMVLEWGEPKNLKALRGFLGLTGYYWRFVQGYGKIAKPLKELLKKGMFEWSEATRTTMEALKIAITIAPVLTLPDFQQEFHMECDASGVVVGAVLVQNKKPIAFLAKPCGGIIG